MSSNGAKTIPTDDMFPSLSEGNTPEPIVPNFLHSRSTSGSRITLTSSQTAIERVKSQDSLHVLQGRGEMVDPRLSKPRPATTDSNH